MSKTTRTKTSKKNAAKRTRLPRAEGRAAIVATATKLFAEKGVEATSFQNIGDALDISQGAVMHHFRNKNELFSACFTAVVANNAKVLDTLIKDEDNARERLIHHFRGTWSWLLKHPHDGSLVCLLYYYATFNPEYTRLYEFIRNEARRKIEIYLLAGVRENIFKTNLDTASAATQLHDYLLGTLINNATIKLGLGKNPPQKQFDSWVELIDLVTKKQK